MSIPNAPSDLIVTDIGVNTLGIAWTDNSSDETYFRIHVYTDTGLMTLVKNVQIDADLTAYSVGAGPENPLDINKHYWITIAAGNADGESDFSDPADAITYPYELRVVNANTTFVSLTWNLYGTVTSLTMQVTTADDPGFASIIEEQTFDPTNIVEWGNGTVGESALDPEMTYLFRIKAASDGDSDWSNVVTVTTLATPVTPPVYQQEFLLIVTEVKTADYTANWGELVRCDPSGGGLTVTLPPAVDNDGWPIVIKNVTSSTNTITIDGDGSETIDGSATASIGSAWGVKDLRSDGANVLVI